MIHELLRQYGSLRDIPEGELEALGYERVHKEGGVIIRQKGADDLAPLRQKVASLYGLEVHELPTLSARYLLRMKRIMANDEEDSGDELEEGGGGAEPDLDEVEPDLDEVTTSRPPPIVFPNLVGYTRAWARGTVAEFKAKRRSWQSATETFAELGLQMQVWEQGIEEWHVEVESGRVVSKHELLACIFGELCTAFRSCIKEELTHPEACLKEVMSRVGAQLSTVESILAAVEGEEDKIRVLLHTILGRTARKGELKEGGEHIGYFHLQRLQHLLSKRADVVQGAFTLRLAKKNPFTDLDIGNNAGCCIGVYLGAEGDEFGGGVGQIHMPRYLLDPATQFLELWRGRQRCGMALLFAATDRQGKPALVVNSIELNTKLSSAADVLVDAMKGWLCAYAKAVGFAYAVMGAHDYNTGFQYGQRSEGVEPIEKGIEKLDFAGWQMYGDVFKDYPSIENVVSIGEMPTAMLALPIDRERFFSIEEAREIFEVVVGPEEYREAGIAIPGDLPPVPYVDRAVVDAFVQQVRTVLGLPEGSKIPAACVLAPTFGQWPKRVNWKTLKGLCDAEADWTDTSMDLQTLREVPLGATVVKTQDLYRGESELWIHRALVLLWAHHLGYPLSERTEPALEFGRKDEDQPCGLRFAEGVAHKVSAPKATSGCLASSLPVDHRR